ncbi:hypothetical protein VCHENC02_2224B, partial [Vibrio harveyi]
SLSMVIINLGQLLRYNQVYKLLERVLDHITEHQER